MKIKWKNVTLLTLSASALLQAASAYALPENGEVELGDASFTQSNDLLKVNQRSHTAQIGWDSFDVAPTEKVKFETPSNDALTINKVKNQLPSKIAGRVESNGKLVIINPAGLIFSEGSQVDAASMMASTLNLESANIKQEVYQANPNSKGQIHNLGHLSTQDKGALLLLANQIINEGKITSDGGQIILASGERIQLDKMQNGQYSLSILEGTKDDSSGIINKYLIESVGGRIQLIAKNDSDSITQVINTSGIVRAGSVAGTKGKIELQGARNNKIAISGLLSSVGKDVGAIGGQIDISADDVHISENAIIDVSAKDDAGSIHIGGNYQGNGPLNNAKEVFIGENVSILANSDDKNAGKIIVWSDEKTTAKGKIQANAHSRVGHGGFIETSSKNELDVIGVQVSAGSVDDNSAGTWLLDPKNITVDNTMASLLNTSLASTNIILETSPTAFAEDGDILFTNNTTPITIPSNKTFEVLAFRNIHLNDTTYPQGLITGNNASLILTTGKTANGIGTLTGNSDLNNIKLNNSTIQININEATKPGGISKYTGLATLTAANPGNDAVSVRRIIKDYAQLKTIRDNVNAGVVDAQTENYILIKDINFNLADVSFVPIGKTSQPFSGTLNGNQFFFNDFVMNKDADSINQGLFGSVLGQNNTKTLFNVFMSNSTLLNVATQNSGILLGSGNHVSLDNIWIQGQNGALNLSVEATSKNLGAVAGKIEGNSNLNNMTSSLFDIKNNDTGNTGGLIGLVSNTLTQNITASKLYTSNGTITNGQNAGGIFGKLDIYAGNLDTLSNASKIVNNTLDNQGGIIGMVSLKGLASNPSNPSITFKNLYNGAEINGANNVGGLIGSLSSQDTSNPSVEITNSVNLGSIKPTGDGKNIGGLIGVENPNIALSITKSANFGQVGGHNQVGGIVGLAHRIQLESVTSMGNLKGGITTPNQMGGFIGLNTNPDTQINQSVAYFKYTGTGNVTKFGGWIGDTSGTAGAININNTYGLVESTNPFTLAAGDLNNNNSSNITVSNGVVSTTNSNNVTTANLTSNFSTGRTAQQLQTDLLPNSQLERINHNGKTSYPVPSARPYKQISITSNMSAGDPPTNIKITYPGNPTTATLDLFPTVGNANLLGFARPSGSSFSSQVISVINTHTDNMFKIAAYISADNDKNMSITPVDNNLVLDNSVATFKNGNETRDLEKISRASLGNFASFTKDTLSLNKGNANITYQLDNLNNTRIKTINKDAGGTGVINIDKLTTQNSAIGNININGSVLVTDNGPLRNSLTINSSASNITIQKSTIDVNFGNNPLYTLTAPAGSVTVSSNSPIGDRDFDITALSNIAINTAITAQQTFNLNSTGSSILVSPSNSLLKNINGQIKLQTTGGVGSITTGALDGKGIDIQSANGDININGTIIGQGEDISVKAIQGNVLVKNGITGKNIVIESKSNNRSTIIDGLITAINNITMESDGLLQIGGIAGGLVTNLKSNAGGIIVSSDINIDSTLDLTGLNDISTKAITSKGKLAALSNAGNVSIDGLINTRSGVAFSSITANKNTLTKGIINSGSLSLTATNGNNSMSGTYTTTDLIVSKDIILIGDTLLNAAGGTIISDNIDGGGYNFTVNGPITLAKNVTNTLNQNYNGKVNLNSGVAPPPTSITLLSSLGAVNFNGSPGLESTNNHSLKIVANTATLNVNQVGNSITDLDLSGVPGTITLNSSIKTIGTQTYKGPVLLSSGDKTFESTNNLDIAFLSAITGSKTAPMNFTIKTNGLVNLNNIADVNNIDLSNANGNITFTGNNIQSIGTQSYKGPVFLKGGNLNQPLTHKFSATTGAITFTDNITGTSFDGLEVVTPSTTAIKNIYSVASLALGGQNPASGGTVTISGTDLLASGPMVFGAPIAFTENLNINNTSTSSNGITFAQTLTGAITKNLTISTLGPASFLGTVTTSAFNLTNATNTITLSQNELSTQFDQIYGGNLILTGSSPSLTSTDGKLIFNGFISSNSANPQNVTLSSFFETQLNGANNIKNLNINSVTNQNILIKGDITTSVTQTYQDLVELAGNAKLSATSFSFQNLPMPNSIYDFELNALGSDLNFVSGFNTTGNLKLSSSSILTASNISGNNVQLFGNKYIQGDNIIANATLTLEGRAGSDITNVFVDQNGDQIAAQLTVVTSNSYGTFLVNKSKVNIQPKPPIARPNLTDNIIATFANTPLDNDDLQESLNLDTNNSYLDIRTLDAPISLAEIEYDTDQYIVKDILPSAGLLSARPSENRLSNMQVGQKPTLDEEMDKSQIAQSDIEEFVFKDKSIKVCISKKGNRISIDCSL